jgi:hypothetical protein
MRQPKRKYAVLLGGKLYATTWAVSAKKAIANIWWKHQKQGDKFKETIYRIGDFDAVEMED